MKNDMSDIKFDIREHIGIIQKGNNGWNKELNLVSWNGQGTPKFDIRSWDEEYEHCSRGITMFRDEMVTLVKLFEEYDANMNKEAAQ